MWEGVELPLVAVASVSHQSDCVIMTNGENGLKLTHHLITADQMHRLLVA